MSGQDDEEDVMVPGFSYGAGPSGAGMGGAGSGFGVGGGAGSRWWGRDDDAMGAHPSSTAAPGTTLAGLTDGFDLRGMPFGGDDAMNSDDFIPGLGAAEHMGNASLPSVAPRQSGPLPPQEDMWSGGGSGGRSEDWGRRSGGAYSGYERRGGSRRGRY